MHVQMLQDSSAETFSKQLLDIGNGKVAVHENTGCIKLPTDFCTIINSQNTLIDHIYPDVQTQYKNLEWLAERAILAAKNVDVNQLNSKIQYLLPGDLVSYKTVDAVCDANKAVNYAIEFLNSIVAITIERWISGYFASFGYTMPFPRTYVACSRVGKPSSLFVLARDGLIKNIVHPIVLRD
ncbi:unnamed protein product [Parnassius mnemosyne]